MRKVVILGSLLVLAMGSANCAGDRNSEESSSSITGPAGVDGKPSGGSSSSISVAMVTDANGDGAPNFGDQVTFNISQTATTTPRVDMTCSQNGTVVLAASTGFFESYPWPWTRIMTLSSQMWTGGAADCTAVLYHYNGGRKNTVLATTRFTANE